MYASTLLFVPASVCRTQDLDLAFEFATQKRWEFTPVVLHGDSSRKKRTENGSHLRAKSKDTSREAHTLRGDVFPLSSRHLSSRHFISVFGTLARVLSDIRVYGHLKENE